MREAWVSRTQSPHWPPLLGLLTSEQAPEAPGSQALPLLFCCCLSLKLLAGWWKWVGSGVRGLWEWILASSFLLFFFPPLFQVLPAFLCLSMNEQRQEAGWTALSDCLYRGNDSHKGLAQPSYFVKCHQPHPEVAISNP